VRLNPVPGDDASPTLVPRSGNLLPLNCAPGITAQCICEKKLVQCPMRSGNSIANTSVRMFTRYGGGVYGGGSAEEGLVF
jgi:hypothetical protein